MDFSTLKKLTIGDIELKQLFIDGIQVWKASSYKNLVTNSPDVDGKPYNGVGYKEGVRLSSGGSVSGNGQAGSVTTGFMEYTYSAPFIIRMKGATWLGESAANSGTHWYVNVYKNDKTFIYGMASSALGTSGNGGGFGSQVQVSYDASSGITTFDFTKSDTSMGAMASAIKSGGFIRINAKGNGQDLIITVNEEIV